MIFLVMKSERLIDYAIFTHRLGWIDFVGSSSRKRVEKDLDCGVACFDLGVLLAVFSIETEC